MSALLELHSVTKDFPLESGCIRVLDRIDLCIAQGTFTVVAGPSGAGKSTLLNLIGGLDRPTSGSITLESVELCDLPDKALTLLRRRRIGFVFQSFNLLPNISTWHNIAMPLLLDGVSPGAARERVTQLAEELGIAPRMNLPARLLSGGEMQRAAVARALVQEPALVLADEPTGNLDSRAGAAVLELLEMSVRRRGRTVLLVTHDVSALPRADRVVTLRDGKIDIPA